MSPRPSSSPSPPTPPPTPPIALDERSFLAKGKYKEVDPSPDAFRDPETPTYPPTNDDAAETHRIEENLRRWDAAERQRRKSVRDSIQPTPSLVSNLSKTASVLWSDKRPRYKHESSLGNHVALHSQENVNSVSIDDLSATPTPSPSSSPTPSRGSDSQNPFANASESLSPFADSSSSGLQMNRSSSTRVPPGPPMPLGLPPPRTPPPIHTAPSPTSPLSTSKPADTAREDIQETMWWHEWLCGCSEGPERGGNYQSGRTNPFE